MKHRSIGKETRLDKDEIAGGSKGFMWFIKEPSFSLENRGGAIHSTWSRRLQCSIRQGEDSVCRFIPPNSRV